MPTILLTYGTRPIAQRIAKALSPHHSIVLASNEEIPTVLSNTYKSIPNPANPVFAHEILKLCLDKNIDLVLPLGVAEIEVLSASIILFEEYGITILRPSISAQQKIAQHIPSDTPLLIAHGGHSLLDKTPTPEMVQNGVYALAADTWLPVII
ncbi:hypothetical protein M8998_09330 [Sphingobacterium sp. lm-10]|uniref:hypothetical protein n=1 Tax=Sphingobacterium sp. lm-10 TaxID=2944904 RepID=UPI002020AC4D|nr:hypothetical protein [Sphingobacterium sp. lm-10]MCL7988136.1 hypothetical protein [Sphingobacterium sp. lm-10]